MGYINFITKLKFKNRYVFITSLFLIKLVLLHIISIKIYAYPFNSPYSKEQVDQKTIFSNFSEQPKHLDPARSYSSDQIRFIGQIYEPLYQYNYLIRPYELEPLSSDGYIIEEYYDLNNHKINNINLEKINNKDILYTVYNIKIKNNIYYQPHPAFVKNKKNNEFLYHNLSDNYINNLNSISDFKIDLDNKDLIYTRELEARDFIYQIKRLADPKVASPIYGLMSNYIVDLDKLNKILNSEYKNNKKYIDLNNHKYDIAGLKLIDKYNYQIKIKGRYPQFKYWLAMTFFVPMPWEADKFYSQKGLDEQNISLDYYPVGTGPYMLTENNPNSKIILVKNPYYNYLNSYGRYPSYDQIKDYKNKEEDKELGLYNNSGKRLPFIDKAEYILEKEGIPIWNKFLQGYYDLTGIGSDNFNSSIEIINNQAELTKSMIKKNIKLIKSMDTSIFYWGFNMLDPVVGAQEESIEEQEKARKLRQAISLIFDIQEYLQIFRNGRGQVATGLIPPGITGYIKKEEDKNNNLNKNKKLKLAKILLKEAGYHDGIDADTNSPLVLNFDAVGTGSPSESALFNWMRKQFKKLDIQLNIRLTQYNQFTEKMRTGRAQMYFYGWNADYPDPENFLFLLLCEQSKVKYNGENDSNYCNKEYDNLFIKMQNEIDQNKKINIINKMIDILKHDSPWILGFYNEQYILSHGWNKPFKVLVIGNNSLKYQDVDYKTRIVKQTSWNKANYNIIFIFLIIFILLILPVYIGYYKKTYSKLERI